MELFQRIIELLTYSPTEPMLFNSGLFVVLFLIFLPLYYFLRNTGTARIIYVVLFSLFFYYKSSGLYFLLLILTATVDFLIGGQIHRAVKKRNQRLWMILSIVFNLGMLCYFKYTNFLIDLFGPLMHQLGAFTGMTSSSYELTALDIFLPVGISFFTFQSMSYIIDIYRGKITPLNRWIDYLFYVSFFPQLVAGPIVRAKEFIPQIHRRPFVTKSEFGEGLFLIICGLVKKVIISDYISLNFVDRVFDSPLLYSGFENLMAIYGYAIQIYCDFSGYSDIAIGIALWLGFRFNINFDFPYQSATITEFWRRWHISLSSWLKDYLYISLGGNRKGKIRTYFNLIITMLLGGLWHGAALRFVLWGLMHGVALAIHKLIMGLFPRQKTVGGEMKAVWRFFGVLFTFHFVAFAWIFFRMPTMEGVGQMLEMIWYEFHPEVILPFFSSYRMVSILILFGFLTHMTPTRLKLKLQEKISATPLPLQALILAVVMIFVVQFKSTGVQPFIYFQF